MLSHCVRDWQNDNLKEKGKDVVKCVDAKSSFALMPLILLQSISLCCIFNGTCSKFIL